MPRIAYLRDLRCSRWVNRPGEVQLSISGDAAGVALLSFINPHWRGFPDNPGGPKYIMEGEARLLGAGTQVVEVEKAGFVFVVPVLPLNYRPRPAEGGEEAEATYLVCWGNESAGAENRRLVELTFSHDRTKTEDNLLLTDEWFTIERSLLPDTHFLDINQTFASLIERRGFTGVRVTLRDTPAGRGPDKDPFVILGSDREGVPLLILDRAHRGEAFVRLQEGLTLTAILANTSEDRQRFEFDADLLPASVSLVF